MGFGDNLKKRLDDALRGIQMEELEDYEELQKVDNESKGTKKETRRYYRRASLVDPNLTASYGGGGYGPYKPRYSHISFKTLKEMSLRDPIVAAIIQTRVNQISSFSGPQASRYDTGYKFIPRDLDMEIKRGSDEEKEIEFLTDFMRNTGLKDHRDPADEMDFDTWLRLIVRDRLTYGAVAIETIRAEDGTIREFLPVPTETIFYANKNLSDDLIDGLAIVNKQSYYPDSKRSAGLEAEEREKMMNQLKAGEYEYVQVLEGRVIEGFTRNGMLYKLGNPQNFIDNNGYAIGELEMATTVVTSHLQAENYNKLFFTHGFAARGLLHIQGDVTPAQLQAFRAQWYAQVSGNSNSWRTPILAGVDKVDWIPLSATNREMEYAQYIDHIIRLLCSLFQISPLEIGFDYLIKGSGQKSLGESDNQWKIKESQNRGLRPLLRWLETIINDNILPEVNNDLAKKYKFCFVGLDAESRTEELERHQTELSTHTSLNNVLREMDRDPVLGGDIPLNQAYMEFLMRTHKVSEIRKKLLKYEDIETDDFDYIPDPNYFSNKMEKGPPEPMMEPGMEDEQDPNAINNTVADYLNQNPDHLDKALLKKSETKEADSRFDKTRADYLKGYKDIEIAMLKEIEEVLKENVGGKEDESNEDN